jgi:hypothetical protein
VAKQDAVPGAFLSGEPGSAQDEGLIDHKRTVPLETTVTKVNALLLAQALRKAQSGRSTMGTVFAR